MGHVVAKPEHKSTKTGKSVVTFAVATNNEWFDAEGTLQKSVDFHRVVAWEKLADVCDKYLDKGIPVYIEGRLTNRRYEGKNKVQYFVTEVVASNVHILKWKQENKALETEELAVR